MPQVARIDYDAVPLDETDAPGAPLGLFQDWFSDAVSAGLVEPHAMVLATVDAAGAPSQRTVLMKSVDGAGVVFFTNRLSRKGRAITANPAVNVLFPWHAVFRQVSMHGVAEPIPDSASEEYFATRPRDSQIAAWASTQSEEAASRSAVERGWQEAARRFADATVPRPGHWGGYLIRCDEVEFWAGRRSRMHDRVIYSSKAGGPAPLDDPDAWRVLRRYP